MKRTLLFILSALILCSCYDDIKRTPDTPTETEAVISGLDVSFVGSDVIYPYPSTEGVTLTFIVKADKKVNDLGVLLTSNKGLVASYQLNEDGMSGIISVTAGEAFAGDCGTLTIDVFNKKAIIGSRNSASMEVTVHKAYLRLPSQELKLACLESDRTFRVESNIDWTIAQDETSKTFSTVEKCKEGFKISVKANETFGTKEGSVTITDAKGILAELNSSFLQEAFGGSRLTDSLALVQFYNEFGGPRWCSTGLTEKWMTDAPLEQWPGLIMRKGRVISINRQFCDKDTYEPINLPIPECLGNLTELWELTLKCSRPTGDVPESFKNLKNLEDFDIGYAQPFRLEDSNLKYISTTLEDFSFYNSQVYGPVPSWLGNIKYPRIYTKSYISGKAPQNLVDNAFMQDSGGIEGQSKNKWGQHTDDDLLKYYPYIDKALHCQIIDLCLYSNYAIWFDEDMPAEVVFVPDQFEGHYEWKDGIEGCLAFINRHNWGKIPIEDYRNGTPWKNYD